MKTQREILIQEVFRRLGGGMVNIELTPEHFEDALDFALATYRQRSSNSVEERYAFLELQPDQSEYILPDEIQEVRQIFRGGYGGAMSNVGSDFEPFAAAVANHTLLGSAGVGGFGGNGGGIPSLVTYELFTGFQELVGRMFGFHIMFNWHPTRHRLDILRKPVANETVMLWVYAHRPDELILSDTYARPWLVRFTTAQAKVMLGEARDRFGTFIGPQGGTTLNGAALKAEGQQEMDALLLELSNQVEQNIGYGFLFG
jgi:hypothetical protein